MYIADRNNRGNALSQLNQTESEAEMKTAKLYITADMPGLFGVMADRDGEREINLVSFDAGAFWIVVDNPENTGECQDQWHGISQDNGISKTLKISDQYVNRCACFLLNK